MSRISQLFSIRSEKVIPFLTAGYPNKLDTAKMVLAADEAGASMVELGMPFSDPLADGPVIQQASQLITSAKHTLIFGVGGGSTVMAQECHHRFFRLDINSHAYSDPMLMRMTAATVDENDVVLCLSLGGVSPDVYQSASIAKEYGAYIIAVCPESDLADLADIHLPITTQEADYIFKPSASRYVMLAAIDILASELAVKNQRKSREKLRRIKVHLDEHRHDSGRLPLGD